MDEIIVTPALREGEPIVKLTLGGAICVELIPAEAFALISALANVLESLDLKVPNPEHN